MNDNMRFAIYTRISMEEQHELSLELQEQKCREAIADRGGIVIDVYSDTNKTGWSLARDGFRRMQQDASQGKFDAIMFWKFDRLARDHAHIIMIKLLLRNEYQLKLFCVEGFSQDDDNDPQHALMEQMLAVFYAFYSQNLSHDTKRGKRHRAMTGDFNGSIPPLGYILITQKEATTDRPAGLYIDRPTADLIRRAFERYATGNYSDGDISDELMEQCQQARKGFFQPKSAPSVIYTYLVGNIVWCARCLHHKPALLDDDNYGKMGETRLKSGFYYRCRSTDRGYENCGQRYIRMEKIDDQVIRALLNFHIPENHRLTVRNAIQAKLDDERSLRKMADIMEIINRVDIRLEEAFINPVEYLRKMDMLKTDYQSQPTLYLPSADDLLNHFNHYWSLCQNHEEQKMCIERILERVMIYDDRVVSITFYGGYVMGLE